MTVSLTPPHLGHVEIEVKTKGNNVEIEMTSQNSAAKSVIESSLHELRQSMQGEALHLSKMEVHVAQESSNQLNAGNFGGNQGGFREASQNFQGQPDTGRFNARFSQDSAPTRGNLANGTPVATSRVATAPGRVDLRI